MLDPQNFSVYAANETDVTIDVDPDDGITLVGADIEWKLYAQEFGQPSGEALLTKTTDDDSVTVDDTSGQLFSFLLTEDDTKDMDPRNYYHEATVRDPGRGPITVAHGILTVLQTKNRSAS